jgi:hypothetical protein
VVSDSRLIGSRARFQRLATGLLLCVTVYAIAIFQLLGGAANVSIPLQWLLTLLSCGALYNALIHASLTAINRSDRLLSLYWGAGLYWRGLWHYTSHHEGTTYLGIWRIDQDALGIRVRAFGLDGQYIRRFTAYSVSDVREASAEPGVYEVINIRHDYEDSEKDESLVYSKSRLVPESPVRLARLCRGPIRMRGETRIYGGRRSGLLARDVVLERHLEVTSEQELTEALHVSGIRYGTAATVDR